MSLVFTITPFKNGDPIPDVSTVSSVSLIAITLEGNIIATKHKTRGFDLPGGHIEFGETIVEALQREVLEEIGATFSDEKLIAVISSNATDEKYRDKMMLVFTTNHIELQSNWLPSNDVSGRVTVSLDEMLSGYYGDKIGMQKLINLAKAL